jgi:hippurate hydrolase
MHVAWLLGAATILAEQRGSWRGTVMAVFQPGEDCGPASKPC